MRERPLFLAARGARRGHGFANEFYRTRVGEKTVTAKTPKSSRTGSLIKKLRKPLAPPTRVAEPERKYKRARERERLHREVNPGEDLSSE